MKLEGCSRQHHHSKSISLKESFLSGLLLLPRLVWSPEVVDVFGPLAVDAEVVEDDDDAADDDVDGM